MEKNRELLITQNSTEENLPRRAERGIGLLLNVLSRLKQAALYVQQGDHITLEFSAGPHGAARIRDEAKAKGVARQNAGCRDDGDGDGS